MRYEEINVGQEVIYKGEVVEVTQKRHGVRCGLIHVTVINPESVNYLNNSVVFPEELEEIK